MISFRYHLVSIIAVFLALALGIVIGTTALNGPITKDLRRQVNDAKKQRDTLATQVKTLQAQVGDANEFAGTFGAQLVTGSLTGKSIVLVSLPNVTSGMQDGVERQLTNAGAKVSGQVSITQDYLDPAQGNGIINLATGADHPLGWTAPPTSDPGTIGGSLLAYALVGKGQKTDTTQVLSGFAALHMITPSSTFTPSTEVVVLTSGSLPVKNTGGGDELDLVSGLVSSGAHVVVGGDSSSATQGGLIALVRANSSQRAVVSTVDDADTSLGQVCAPLVLAATTKGDVGQYGTGQGADALFPAPAR
jgi:Copper transport outer membrane protein, MctB